MKKGVIRAESLRFGAELGTTAHAMPIRQCSIGSDPSSYILQQFAPNDVLTAAEAESSSSDPSKRVLDHFATVSEIIQEIPKSDGLVQFAGAVAGSFKVYGTLWDDFGVVPGCLNLDTLLHDIESSKCADLRKKLSPAKKLDIMRSVAVGMRDLHAAGCVHRSLSTQSVWIDKDLNARIADYGLRSFLVSSTTAKDDKTPLGETETVVSGMLSMSDLGEESKDFLSDTLGYLGMTFCAPPEVLDGEELMEESEIYCFALLCYELLTGKKPYEDIVLKVEIGKLIDMIRTEDVRPTFSVFSNALEEDLKQLVINCWIPNPFERPPFSDIVDHLEALKIKHSI